MLGDEPLGSHVVVGELPRRVADRVGRDAAAAATVIELVPDDALFLRRDQILDLERFSGEGTDLRLRRDVDLQRPDPAVGMDFPGARSGSAARGDRDGEQSERSSHLFCRKAAKEPATAATIVIAHNSRRMSTIRPPVVTGFLICEETVRSCVVTQKNPWKTEEM